MSWDAAVLDELRRVYTDAVAGVLITPGGTLYAAHDEGLRAVAALAIAIERDRIFEPPSF